MRNTGKTNAAKVHVSTGQVNDEMLLTQEFVSASWPHIARHLHIDRATNTIDDSYFTWQFANERVRLPNLEFAAALEEWADYYAWSFERRRPRFGDDRNTRSLVERWTDSIVYLLQRRAAYARGEDPGNFVPQWERRPGLDAEHWEIVDEIAAKMDANKPSQLHGVD